MTTETQRATIGYADYFHEPNGWALYRSFGSAEARDWYFERLPDEDHRQYRIVRHHSRYYIATRETFADTTHRETVKRATLFDGVVDTMQTETELNGWRPVQGRML